MFNNCNEKLVLEVKQGETRQFVFNVTQGYETNEELPLDLTGKSLIFTVRPSPYDTVTPVFSKTITIDETNDGYISNPTNGEFIVNILNTDWKSYPVQDYYLSIYVVDEEQQYSISGDGDTSSIIRFCKC